MSIRARLKSMSFAQLFKLATLFIAHPGYVFLTARASKKAMHLATQVYGNTHHKSNRGNAFRHALWTVLLGQEVYRKSDNLEKAKNWAKQFTNLHEEIFVNNQLDRAMDLHNNNFGIQKLKELVTSTETETLEFLKTEAEKAIQITQAEETKQHPLNLVDILAL